MTRFVILLALVACGGAEVAPEITPGPMAEPMLRVNSPAAPRAIVEQGVSGEVVETMDAAGYTYALVRTADGDRWVAGPKTTLQLGSPIAVGRGSLMADFHSKTLDRTFAEIWFVMSWDAAGTPSGHPAVAQAPAGGQPTAASEPVTPTEVVPGSQTVEQVLAQGAALATKQITVQGEVVKVNLGIMGRNWVHLRSSASAEPDLLVTTDEAPAVGDHVAATGVIATDRTFGAGYSYDMVLEQGRFEASP